MGILSQMGPIVFFFFFFFFVCFCFTNRLPYETEARTRKIQPNFNGSNTFGTMKICSREGQFELMSVNRNARSGSIMISFNFL